MKALVTGGAGFIGSHVVDLLLERGWEVAVVDNLSTGREENLDKRAVFCGGDVCDAVGLDAVFCREKPEVVFHLAAQTNARTSLKVPAEDAVTNLVGSINVLECCRRHGVRKVVYSSSCAVYGVPVGLPVKETHLLAPVFPYGCSKRAVEDYLWVYRELYGLDFVALRYANVYGPRQDGRGEGGVIAVFADRISEGAALELKGDGLQTRDFVFVKEVAEANLLAVERGSGKFLNIGSGKETSVNEVVSLLSRLSGRVPEVRRGPAVKGEVRRMCLGVSLAKEELGWSSRVSVEGGLLETMEWLNKGRGR
ncbi:hypothetical protein AUJ65_02130 [Candidatus Micrarchaeota archaeon CG1_02_51_15]|nr:MAG: hypothetical protein AUJ65_02130 [Candidatus Micrarchaeota archaeon CG1_02_51_15]